MKYILTILIVLIGSCTTQKEITGEEQNKFEQVAKEFQEKYTNGSGNCEDIIKAIDKDVKMSEIRFSAPAMELTHDQLIQFCPHLPKKEVIQTQTEQRLISPTLAYDYVSQLYLRKSLGDTVRETTSRIWELKNKEWKIIQMNSSLSKACD